MGDVKVYKNDSGEHLYDVDVQYLSLDRNNISIELRRNNMKDNKEENNGYTKKRRKTRRRGRQDSERDHRKEGGPLTSI